jgi:DNA-binding CsgD family transcriptional regulator
MPEAILISVNVGKWRYTDIFNGNNSVMDKYLQIGIGFLNPNYESLQAKKKEMYNLDPPMTLENSSALSQRELAVLQLVAKGLTSRRIAESLDITTQTVQTHRRNMLRKTSCSNTQQLVGLAVSSGWTKLDE